MEFDELPHSHYVYGHWKAIYYWRNVNSTLIFQPAGYTSALIAPNAGVTYASLQANEDKGQLQKLSNYIKTMSYLLFDQLAVSQIFIFKFEYHFIIKKLFAIKKIWYQYDQVLTA